MSNFVINPYLDVACSPSNNFDILSEWTQSPTGTVTWSSGSPNYARNSCLIESLNWEFTCNPAGSTFTGNTATAGVTRVAVPFEKQSMNYGWVVADISTTPTMYWSYRMPDGSSGIQGSIPYVTDAIYSIKCVNGTVTFYENGVSKKVVPSSHDFDPTANTNAYFGVTEAQESTTCVITAETT